MEACHKHCSVPHSQPIPVAPELHRPVLDASSFCQAHMLGTLLPAVAVNLSVMY